MKYLVLGSAGQVGTHLVEFLKNKNYNVETFDIEHSKHEDLRIYNNTILREKIEGCDFVFFLAFDVGGSRYLQKYQNTFEFVDNNTRLMSNTFSLLKEFNKPFIFASSQMSNMDYSCYGTQKRLGEYYTQVLNGLTVKFWNVYGLEKDETKSHVITDFIKKALVYKRIDMLTNGEEERQFLFAEDCCECLEALSLKYDSLNKNEEYHITSFEWDKIIDVANIIKKYLPCEVEPAATLDNVQKNKRNEPDPSILRFWKPRTNLENGILKMIKEYSK
jgi:nucleoside-diphosphate-sugar epimerase